MSEVLRIAESMRAWEESLRRSGHEVPKTDLRKPPNGDPQVMSMAANRIHMPSDAELEKTIARLKAEKQ